MSLELTKADLLQAHTDALVTVYSRPENLAIMGEVAAKSIAQMFELLSPAAAAALLGKAESTLMRNHVEWGIDKSVAFGRETSLFFLSQIVAAAKGEVVHGRKASAGKVTEFPQKQPQQKAS